MSTTGKDISKASELLKDGEVVAIPTETVYGLAANALNETAVLKIFSVKERPHYNPLILHIGKKEDLYLYAENVPEIALKLIDAFWPGPLTILLPKKNNVPHLVTSGLPDVAIRLPNHPLTLELLSAVDFPLAAPSANPFGYISPTAPEHVEKQIGHKISYILDGGSCEKGVESTIVGFENNHVLLYRTGAIPVEEIEKVAGKVILANKTTHTPKASGMLPFHYAPHTPFILSEHPEAEVKKYSNKKIGIIAFTKPSLSESENLKIVVLSQNKNISEAARNLYGALHYLDAMKLDLIIAEKFEEKGLGITLNDRLTKASKRGVE